EIIRAYITFTANENKTTSTVNARIRAINADNATAPLSYSAAEGASRTTSYADWNSISSFTSGGKYKSADFKSVVQEIINRPGWNGGNSIVIYSEDNGSTASLYNYRR